MISLLLVDDQRSIREGLRMRLALEPDLKIVGEACDGQEALQLTPDLHPDVVLMDVEMPCLDGIAATKALRGMAPQTRVILLSIHDDVRIRDQARAAGASAFVAKQAGDAALLTAIRQAAAHPGAGEAA